jgi:hypothetical protein
MGKRKKVKLVLMMGEGEQGGRGIFTLNYFY